MRRLGMMLAGLALTGAVAAPCRAEAAGDTLTVVTLNIWHDRPEWPRRLGVILAGLRALEPDVVCLQEVLEHDSLRNQAATLADSLGARYHFTSVDPPGAAKRYGNAILARHPVLATGGRSLDPGNDYRTVAHVRIDFRGRPVEVYDTHLHHTTGGGAIRAVQVRDLLAFVDSTRGDGPVVLAGDFNAEPGSPELRPLAPGFADAFAAANAGGARPATMNPLLGGEPRAIDHVYVAPGRDARLEPVLARLLFDAPGPGGAWASDHFGVLVRLVRRVAE